MYLMLDASRVSLTNIASGPPGSIFIITNKSKETPRSIGIIAATRFSTYLLRPDIDREVVTSVVQRVQHSPQERPEGSLSNLRRRPVK